MDQLLARPDVQSGVIPFVVALIVALLLRPLGWRWAGLALASGFYAATYVIESGVGLALRSSTDKLLVAGLGAVVLGLAIDTLPGERRRWLTVVLGVLAGGVGLWLVEPLLGRQEGSALLLLTAGAFAYPAWHAAWSEELRDDPLRGATAAWVLALGTAACAILGASARLGQLAIALGAAAGAVWLVIVILGRIRAASLFNLPAALLGALLGLAAANYARLPWQGLAVLALVPVLARLPVPEHWPRWVRGPLLALYTVPIAALAVWLVWSQTATDSPYGY